MSFYGQECRLIHYGITAASKSLCAITLAENLGMLRNSTKYANYEILELIVQNFQIISCLVNFTSGMC